MNTIALIVLALLVGGVIGYFVAGVATAPTSDINSIEVVEDQSSGVQGQKNIADLANPFAEEDSDYQNPFSDDAFNPFSN